MTPLPLAQPVSPIPAQPHGKDPLRQAAIELEASFLAEMLRSAGFGRSGGATPGGPGEEQFQSFLLRAQAEEMAKAGGIGLAQSLYEALKERQNA